MKIIEINDRDLLNRFVAEQRMSQSLQSWQWGELQKSLGFQVRRVGLEDNEGKLIIAATLIIRKIGLNKSYFFCPRGPVVAQEYINDTAVLNLFLTEVKNMAKKAKSIFLRIESTLDIDFGASDFSLVKTIDIEPKSTAILDLEQAEEEILQKMHHKTRYNIRLAVKKGVVIKEADQKDFEEFWHLLQETGKRDSFDTHSKKYYQASLDLDFMKMYFAEYQGRVISAGLFAWFGDTATYVHGASAYKYRNLMAPYLLQWELIKKARQDGFKYYDFFGIDEKKWPGVTRFKSGFSGKTINYQGTMDVVFNHHWYQVYKVIRKIRRIF